MGCDIHLFAEVKINGVWHCYSKCPGDRNYIMFARMANVRNYNHYNVEPISEPRDLPQDVSEVVKIERENWGVDGHSDSWLSLEEVEELTKWYENTNRESDIHLPFEHFACYLSGNGWSKENLLPQYEDARLVFWFDN